MNDKRQSLANEIRILRKIVNGLREYASLYGGNYSGEALRRFEALLADALEERKLA